VLKETQRIGSRYVSPIHAHKTGNTQIAILKSRRKRIRKSCSFDFSFEGHSFVPGQWGMIYLWKIDCMS
jgi:hypothetical protein